MKTIGFFNNKGGVGKTSLVYHLAWMMGLHGVRVIAADLDPQANLTSSFLTEDELEAVWQETPKATIYGIVSPLFRGTGEIGASMPREIDENIALLLGDLELSGIEDDLATAWPDCGDGKERAFRVISSLARTIAMAAHDFQADVALVDVGPNLGALNRAALLACDYVVVPVGADLFSLQGLRNMGPKLREWRRQWQDRRGNNPDPGLWLPGGDMTMVGYIVMRHSISAGKPARAYSKWIERMPGEYRIWVLGQPTTVAVDVDDHPFRLATLKDYRSLMPLAHEARKPMFLLRPADGAFGGHQAAVQNCYADFKKLAAKVLEGCGLPPMERARAAAASAPAAATAGSP